MAEQDEMVTVSREARAIALLRDFLENVQWQGKTGFNLREKEMEQGATDALSALLVLEATTTTGGIAAAAEQAAHAVGLRPTKLTAEEGAELDRMIATRAAPPLNPPRRVPLALGIEAAAEQAAREWVAEHPWLMESAYRGRLGAATADAAYVYSTRIPAALVAGAVFVDTARSLLTAPAPLGEEKT